MQIFGDAAINDEMVRAAVGGAVPQRDQLVAALAHPVRSMIAVRLSPAPWQNHALEDLAQQVFMDICEGLGNLRTPTAVGLRNFVSVIVARRVADLLRERKPAASLDAGGDSDSSGLARWCDLLSASGLTPHRASVRAESLRSVAESLAGMADEDRDVITLAFFDQLPIGQIAERLNISRAAATMTLIRALRTLRRTVTGTSRADVTHAKRAG